MATSLAFDIIAKDRASDTFDRIGKSAKSSHSHLMNFAKVGAIFGGATYAVGKLGGALVNMGKNAIEDAASQRKLAVALENSVGATRNQIGAVEDWISAQGVALGVTDDELRPAFQRLVQATGDIGKAQKLAAIAMDASAGSGKSLKVVTEAIAKAQNGNLGSLSRLGIAIKNADGSTKTFDQTMKEMSKTFSGQASAAANTAQGKFDRLKLVMDETKESIGAKLIPVALKFADFMLTKVIPASEKVGTTLGRVSGFVKQHQTAIIALTTTIAALVVITKIHAAVMAVQAAGGLLKYIAATKIVTTVTRVWTATQWLLNAALTANPVGIVIVAIAALAAGIVIAWRKSETFRDIVMKLGAALVKMGEWGVRAFSFLLRAAFATFSGILAAADKGLGWIPGIGDKIGHAREAFDNFRNRTVANLDAVANRLAIVHNKLAGIPSHKTVMVSVAVQTSGKLPSGVTLASYAHGTSYHPGGFAQINETGPETVLLPRGSRVIPAGRQAGGGMDQPITLQVVLDSQIIWQGQKRLYRMTNGAMGVA